MMAGIRAENTRPEVLVRKLLFAQGFRFRLHRADLEGKPDIVLPKHRAIVFVHGCFWHGHKDCRYFKIPSSNTAFWTRKIEGNAVRDATVRSNLRKAGWRVLVVWECSTRLDDSRRSLASQSAICRLTLPVATLASWSSPPEPPKTCKRHKSGEAVFVVFLR